MKPHQIVLAQAAQSVCAASGAAMQDRDAEDSFRFFALRLREAGMIKSTPQKLIAQGTDWRFLNELEKGLKA